MNEFELASKKPEKKRFKKDTLLTKSKIKERGWTEGLIEKFLPNPDSLCTNPVFKCASPMKLYYLLKVEKIEKSKRFLELKNSLSSRKSGAKKAAETKRIKTQKYVDSLNIEVEKFSRHDLIENACDQYNAYKEYIQSERSEWFDFEPASSRSDQSFLNRICVNFLRHQATKYEQCLDDTKGKVGTNKAYFEIKIKVLNAIAKEYPWLEHECSRQEKDLDE